MPEVVVVASFTSRPGKEQEGLEVFQSLLEPTHAEQGCILYSLHQAAEDPARLVFVERWASKEDLDAHLASDHIAAALGRLEELFGDSADIVVYEPRPGGERTKGSLAEHAAG